MQRPIRDCGRKLVDEICHRDGIPLLVLHDFDKAGFSICHNLGQVSDAAEESGTVAYQFQERYSKSWIWDCDWVTSSA